MKGEGCREIVFVKGWAEKIVVGDSDKDCCWQSSLLVMKVVNNHIVCDG